jgi:hypothetical protein
VFWIQNKNEGWTIKWKILEFCRIMLKSCRLWFFIEHFFVTIFLHLNMHICIFLHCGLHSLQVLHNKWCSFHYVCITWKNTIENFNRPKRKDVLFSLIFFICFFSSFFFLCDLIIWLSFVHHIISMQHESYDINSFILLQTCFKWNGYSSFKKREKNLIIKNLHNYQIT